MEFEWDEAKASSNLQKHGVRFDQAIAAFDDPDRLEIVDTGFDYDEERVILIGMAVPGVLVIIYTERGLRTRITSARKASRYEREHYYRQKMP